MLQAVFVIVAVTLLVSMPRLTGDPALMLSQGSGSVTEQDLANIRQALGLNRPFHEQYLSHMQGLLHGDFGRSFMGGTPVAKLIGDALPATLMLAFSSLIAPILISLPLGIQAAIKRGKPTDQAIRILSLVGLSFPNFWLALMLVLLLSITFPLLPPSGWSGPASLVPPSPTMAIILSATNIRLVRTTMLETLSAQYIMVARSRPEGTRGAVQARAAQLRDSAHHLPGPAVRRPDRRHRGHRDGVQLARPGHAGVRRHLRPRLPVLQARSRCWPPSSSWST